MYRNSRKRGQFGSVYGFSYITILILTTLLAAFIKSMNMSIQSTAIPSFATTGKSVEEITEEFKESLSANLSCENLVADNSFYIYLKTICHLIKNHSSIQFFIDLLETTVEENVEKFSTSLVKPPKSKSKQESIVTARAEIMKTV
jgi:hypothetical protein